MQLSKNQNIKASINYSQNPSLTVHGGRFLMPIRKACRNCLLEDMHTVQVTDYPYLPAFLLCFKRWLYFRFLPKHFDIITELVYYNYRYYSPELGRWISRDPIEEQGGLNLYGFVGNAGVNHIDIHGLFRIPDWLVRIVGQLLSSDLNPQKRDSGSLTGAFSEGQAICEEVRPRKPEGERCGCCLVQVRVTYKTTHRGWGQDAKAYELLSAHLVEKKCEEARHREQLTNPINKYSYIKYREYDW